MRWSLLGFILGMLTQSVLAQPISSYPVVDVAEGYGQFLGRSLAYLIGDHSPDNAMSESWQTRYVLGSGRVLSVGHPQSIVWYRLGLLNSSEKSVSIFLNLANSHGGYSQVYLDGQIVSEIGSRAILEERLVHIILPPKRVSTIFIRNYSVGAHVIYWQYWLSEKDAAVFFASEYAMIQATFIIGSMTIFFNSMLFYAYRRRVFLLYVGYVSSFLVFTISATNFTRITWLAQFSMLSLPCITLFSSLFTADFLGLHKSKGWLLRITQLGFVVSALILMLMPINPVLGMTFMNASAPIMIPLLLTCGIVRVFQGHDNAILYTIAFGAMLAGAVLSSMRYSGIMVADSISPWIFWYGVGCENILLMLAIGRQVAETETNRRESHKLLARNYEKLNHSIKQLAKVYYPHQLQMMLENKQLEETMPIGEHEAFVLSFDVMSSSALMSNDMNHFLRTAFTKCSEAMRVGYDPDKKTANGFRLKEMGDGFICTVGFPFSVPGPHPPAEAAFRLAQTFVRIFGECQRSYGFPKVIHCAVGLAQGSVSGAFTWSLPVEYDLYGRGIVLAKRYEEMRKTSQLFEQDVDIIIVQESVYHQLSVESRQQLIYLNLFERNLQTRDDSDAKGLYYQSLSLTQ